MSTETIAIILSISGLNITTLICGIVHIVNRLTIIETDIKWIKQGCPKCKDLQDEK